MKPPPHPARRLLRATFTTLRTPALTLALLAGLAAPAAYAEVTVTHITAAQTPGTKEVVITYDVASTAASTVTVSLAVKDGATPIPATSLSGHFGAGVPTGTGRRIVWNAGADWNGNVVAGVSFNLTADDGVAPSPAGMVLVPGGTLPSIGNGALNVATFCIGKYEVTGSEWQTVRSWASTNGYDIGGDGGAGAGDHPVIGVKWYAAVKWCNAKSERESRTPVYRVGGNIYRSGQNNNVAIDEAANGYRLPSDAEWEYAARGGTRTQSYTYSGSNDLDAVGWYWDNSSGSILDLGSGRGTWPVGQKVANELGLHDMSGNTSEWCFDSHPQTSYGTRVTRGGCSGAGADNCRVGSRDYVAPDFWQGYYGLRVACSQDGTIAAPTSATTAASLDTRDYTLAVASAQGGNPVPGIGTHSTYCWRSTVTPSVDAVAGGYNCTGWTGTGSIPTTGSANTTGPITLTEVASTIAWQWQANTYTLTFDAQGGTVPSPTSKDVTFDAAYGPLVTTTLDGHAFAGWWTAVAGTGTEVTAETLVTTAGNHTLYAKWTAQTASISDNFNDGVLNTSIWTTALPFGDSVASEESSGYFHLGGLGHLVTKAEFNPATAPIDLTVRFSTPSSGNGTYFMTRSDGVAARNGILFTSGNQVDGTWFTIHRCVNGATVIMAQGYFALSLGTWYDLRITDDGTHIALYVNNTLVVSANDSTAFSANHVMFADRPNHGWMNNHMYLDSVSIAVGSPQPTTHLVTLHPGDHGSIPGANSGTDYVTTVTHSAAFAPPAPVPHAGWTFTGWNPNLPAAITGAITATAAYEATSPTALTLTSSTVAENAPAGTVVGTLAGSGGSGSYSYALVTGSGDTDNAKFAITNDQLKVTGALDYEVQTTAAIRVRVTDAHSGNSYEKPFTLTLIDDDTEDGDNDGLTDAEEDTATTSRTNSDTDGDGLNDGAEVNHPTHATNPISADSDGDGLKDKTELDNLGLGLNPTSNQSALVAEIAGAIREDTTQQQTHDLYPESAIRNIHVGAPLIRIINGQFRLQLQLQKSDDLETWTGFGAPAEWTDPVVGNKAFYRLFFDSTKP